MGKFTDTEFHALIAITFCEMGRVNNIVHNKANDADATIHLPDRIHQIFENTRAKVFVELQHYYRDELKIVDFSTRLGTLMTLSAVLTVFQWSLSRGNLKLQEFLNSHEQLNLYSALFDVKSECELLKEALNWIGKWIAWQLWSKYQNIKNMINDFVWYWKSTWSGLLTICVFVPVEGIAMGSQHPKCPVQMSPLSLSAVPNNNWARIAFPSLFPPPCAISRNISSWKSLFSTILFSHVLRDIGLISLASPHYCFLSSIYFAFERSLNCCSLPIYVYSLFSQSSSPL